MGRIVGRAGCQRHLASAVVRGKTAEISARVEKSVSTQERVMKKSMLFGALAILGTAPVPAGPPRLNAREANQHARIHQGVQSGALTKPEARRLRVGEA